MSELHELPTRRTPTLRAQLLGVALVPSLLLLGGGLAVSGVLLADAVGAQDRAAAMSAAQDGVLTLLPAVAEERRLSLLAAQGGRRTGLDAARQAVDAAATGLRPRLADLDRIGVDELTGDDTGLRSAIDAFGSLRRGVDSGGTGRLEIAQGYGEAQDAGLELVAAIGPRSAGEQATQARNDAEILLRAADQLARGTSFAVAAYSGGGLTIAEQAWFAQQIGVYDSELNQLDNSRLDGDGSAKLAELRSSAGFATVETSEDAVTVSRAADTPIAVGAPARASTVDVAAYGTAAGTVVSTLQGLGSDELAFASQSDATTTAAAFRRALSISVLLAAVGVGVLVLALRLSSRLIRRLAHLRDGSLRRAQQDLPAMVERLRAGARDGVSTSFPPLDDLDDEIGQVAAAFELAQQAALDAAAGEAAARAGFNAVFLNIAHRSQGIVHRQLRTIDEAERAEADPEQLARLFQLDHLATRERRNAENLIIMGGGQPGRQWRDPVALLDVVRSAVSEAVQYNRVTIGRMPSIAVVGTGVADVVHLLAELLDNATSFSPPESQIEVRGNLAGRGLVIEVEDQGLGIESSRRAELNELLAKPTDFGVLGLSEDSRLGMFVVARLAQRHDVRITLLESAFGGVRAVILLPSAMLDNRVAVARPGEGASAPGPDAITARPVPATITNGNGNGNGGSGSVGGNGSIGGSGSVGGNGSAAANGSIGGGNGHGALALAEPREIAAAPDPARPPLPRRRRHEAIAPQLMREPDQVPAPGAVDDDDAGERSRSVLGNLQRRTREARTDEEDTHDGQ